MKLDLDAAFARLEDLQRRMGVREEARVPAAELRKLGQSGIEVELDDVRPAPGGNLAWKGQAVLLYIRDQYGAPSNGWSQYKYHLAECTTIQSMRTQGRGDKYLVTNRTDGWFPVRTSAYGGGAETTVRMNVCRNCLYLLDWDGYRSTPRTKDAAYRAFDLREYFDTYQDRPVAAPPPPPAAPPRAAPAPRPPIRIPKPGELPPWRRPAPPPAAPVPAPPPPAPAPSPPAPAPPPAAPTLYEPPWSHAIADAAYRKAVLHIHQFGTLGESELTGIVGGARRVRRFSQVLDDVKSDLPFRITVTTKNGVRTFRRA